MRLIVIREAKDGGTGAGTGLLRYALSTAPLADVMMDGLQHLWCCSKNDGSAKRMGAAGLADSVWVVPGGWQEELAARPGRMTVCLDAPGVVLAGLKRRLTHPWLVISNGRFATHINCPLLGQVLADTRADVVAVTACAELLAYREQVRLTPDKGLVGYRRLYADSVAPGPVPADWPHHLFVRRTAAEPVLGADWSSRFDALVRECRTRGLDVRGVAVAGSALDLESEAGLLALCQVALGRAPRLRRGARDISRGRTPASGRDHEISPQARLIGPVLLGEQVAIEADAVVVGPSVLCDGSTIRRGAIIDSSIVGAGASIEPNGVLRNVILAPPTPAPGAGRAAAPRTGRLSQEHLCSREASVFRTWPRLSYARCLKRMADVAATVIVLALFAPVIPLIALAVKLSSPGPVFFKDKRQGLHGRLFECIKFRTMSAGADRIQEKLRSVSEVDGPQFKMADDPRITAVGRFLRDTYLDEVPQFLNVLRGQMSVVGPRPSPEAENTLCPSWRDARLSVRPGITGLWQVCRTREPRKDFQEWIHYDVRYVREFSPRLDLWICWRTFTRMVENFADQF